MVDVNESEEWRPVLSGNYEISSIGRIRRATPGRRTYPGRLMSLVKLKIGYFSVRPTINGKNKSILIHDLVASAFIGPRPEGYSVNHKDGVKTNNHVSNLEYVTHRENMRHARETGLIKNQKPRALVTADQVREIRALYDSGMPLLEIGARYGMARPSVCMIGKRRNWKDVK